MARRPDILSDRDNWGAVLNDYLDVSLAEDGTIRPEAVPAAQPGAPTEPERTLSVVGDLHIGYDVQGPEQQAAADARMDEVFADLASLSGMASRRLFVGDMVEKPETSGTTPGWRDTEFLSRANALPEPWDAVAGNHDVSTDRTMADWASVYDYNAANWVKDYGFVRVIAVAPNAYSSGSILSASTLAFMEEELRKSRKDTIILCHYPLYGTVAANMVTSPFTTFTLDSTEYAKPDADIRAVLDKYPHARVWLGAHRHPEIMTAPRAITHVWTGSRSIAVINAGAPVYTDNRVGPAGDDPPRSLYLTMLDDRAEVRVRNHRDQTWEAYGGFDAYPVRWNLPAEEVPATDNPATMVMTFDGEIAGRDRGGAVAYTLSGTETYDETAGRKGLELTSGRNLKMDPRPWITAESGTIVARARFLNSTESSVTYIVQHLNDATHRITIQRNDANEVSGRIGSGGRMSYVPVSDVTDIHTYGVSWRNGWFGLSYLDGKMVGDIRSTNSTTGFSEMTTISPEIAVSPSGSSVVVYELFFSNRELSEAEHAKLHATAGNWTWDTLA